MYNTSTKAIKEDLSNKSYRFYQMKPIFFHNALGKCKKYNNIH